VGLVAASPLFGGECEYILKSFGNKKDSTMVQDCGATIAKYLLCVFNFVFFVSPFFTKS
jgi:hypothetical protein